jgi:hypothetical protein
MPGSPTNAVSSCSACNGVTTRRHAAALWRLPLTLLILLPPLTWAQSSPGRFEITPYAGYRFGGTFQDEASDAEAGLSDHASAGLILNLRESANTQWELIFARQSTEADVAQFDFPFPTIDVDVETLQLGGTYLGDGQRARPYLAATIGGTRFSPTLTDLDGDTFWSFSIGGGLQVSPSTRFGLRLEARLWGTLTEADTDLFCASGPQGALCAIAIDGEMLWQFETYAGLVFRF